MTELAVVNPVPLEAAADWVRALMMTHLHDVHGDDMPRITAAWTRDWDPARMWGVRDHGRWVATLATEQRTLTVPGSGGSTTDLTVDGLTAVAVSATHRRHGLMTRMLVPSLQAARDGGAAVSMLIAAEWPIYGRFGYAPATSSANYRFLPRQAGPPTFGEPGRVRQVHRSELGAIGPAVFDAARRGRAGQVDRGGLWWDRSLGLGGFDPPAHAHRNWFVHDGPDGPDGFLGWKTSRDFELNGPLGALEVSGPVAATEAAYLDLWAYLSGIDAIDQIDLNTRPVDEPIRWRLGDGRALKQTDSCDLLWLRLLDVPAALAGRRYAVPGRLVLDVTDSAPGGFAAGRYALTATVDGSECRPVDEPADVEIPQRTLASIYLGGHRLRQLGTAAGVRENRAGAVDLLDLMFSTSRPPWTQTYF